MPFFYFNSFILFLLIIFPFGLINSKALKIQSIIVLEDKIPKECGINISNLKDSTNAKISIVKLRKDEIVKTSITFEISSKIKKIKHSNITTSSINLNELFKNRESIEEDKKSLFFQELLIDGLTLHINNEKLKIPGPIDSKVRLEYLFCSGEMFHPKYEK